MLKFMMIATALTALATSAFALEENPPQVAASAKANVYALKLRDGPLTKCMIRARDNYTRCAKNAKTSKAKKQCQKALSKAVNLCQKKYT